jgi:choline dehydrogenase-like flavoprotein
MTYSHYDVIIIGTGAGGGTLAYHLAPSGKKILILERGSFLPREKENWSALEVYQRERYHTQEQWFDRNDKVFRPTAGYWVGGNTKVYRLLPSVTGIENQVGDWDASGQTRTVHLSDHSSVQERLTKYEHPQYYCKLADGSKSALHAT